MAVGCGVAVGLGVDVGFGASVAKMTAASAACIGEGEASSRPGETGKARLIKIIITMRNPRVPFILPFLLCKSACRAIIRYLPLAFAVEKLNLRLG
jgi:hypothetical protein